MPDNNKKDSLGKLFQKKAGDYEIPFHEADWLELENRLDVVDKQYASRKKQRWIAVASILVFSLLAYFTYENYRRINQLSRQLSAETVENAQQGTAPEEELSRTKDDQPVVNEKRGDIAENNSVQSKGLKTPLYPPARETLYQTGAEPEKKKGEPGAGNRASGNFLATGGVGSELFVPELSCPECGLSRPAAKDEQLVVSRIESSKPEIKNTGLIAANSTLSASAHSGNTRQSPPRVAMGLVMGPDFSTAGSISNFYNPGHEIGVTVEYNLNPNFAIRAGIIQSEVRYVAHGREYNPPPGYWTGGITPYKTIGECLLIDIPISLKYNFLHFDRSRFYATAGLTSYIMLSEDYRFNYDSDEAGLVQDWSGKTGTRHWMSNAGFSIGYEFDILPEWSIRAEPFVKIPLKEVGWGNVKLYSLGSFISINYKFGG